MAFSVDDHGFMSRAIQLAKRGLYTTDPNPRVGCVIVNAGTIVGEGWHQVAGGAHAEVNALAAAGHRAEGATVYVSLEPCCHHGKTPPCTDALIAAKVERVVVAMQDPNPRVAGNGLQQLTNAGIVAEVGLLEIQVHELNPGFIQRMKTSRPYVRSKLAMSVDGRTAMADGESKWITSDSARLDVQRLRARSSAIVTGAGTVLADDPAMTVRLENTERQPDRIIIDTNLSTPTNAKILKQPGQTHILTCSDDESAIDQLTQAGARVVILPKVKNRVDLHAMMDYLNELEVNEVLLETGATLSGAMLEEKLIDEVIIYMAPVVMGDQARGLFSLPHLNSMTDKIELTLKSTRMLGNDIRLTYIPN
ncbi:Diaminohydroxyphosphoribosylaminopyrimidine deaminase / 5-amino-6-(5-phosphoribosylamino)uracil reductase [hydrothermal vent metagenome]|uniref:Diaminohydroxyphosphoribosylaminopyrimidine deaminase / 5-amino-6-(5-phosphoribosylamino)uracil reductase n=1 Tax=hydrothermal vent metagenome TaxID=652676 RepID=A0A3B0ZNR0_9ZZZZ